MVSKERFDRSMVEGVDVSDAVSSPEVSDVTAAPEVSVVCVVAVVSELDVVSSAYTDATGTISIAATHVAATAFLKSNIKNNSLKMDTQ